MGVFPADALANSHAAQRRRLDAEFWTKVRREGECWIWTGKRIARVGWDYGTLLRNGRQVYAHRHAYERAFGSIPAGLEVLHRCDNPPCINPAHLRIGTHAENMADMKSKGRGRGGPGYPATLRAWNETRRNLREERRSK